MTTKSKTKKEIHYRCKKSLPAEALAKEGGDGMSPENVLELVNDAWNYFPRKVIGGLSPAEKLLEYREKQC